MPDISETQMAAQLSNSQITADYAGATLFDSGREMIETRKEFATIFRWTIGVVGILVAVTIITLLSLTFVDMDSMEKVVIGRLLQVSFGMILGATCVVFGVILTWLGTTAAYSLGAKAEGVGHLGQLRFAGTSPGLLPIVGGIVLIGVSLYRPLEYFRTEEHVPSGSSIVEQPAVEDQTA